MDREATISAGALLGFFLGFVSLVVGLLQGGMNVWTVVAGVFGFVSLVALVLMIGSLDPVHHE